MTTQEELFLEVENTFKSYAEAGLIDRISMRRWLKSELKRFGTNIMELTEDIVEVRNGYGNLPDNFWKLQEAWKHEPFCYTIDEGDESIIQKNGAWRTRVVYTGTCDVCEDTPKDTMVVKEEFYFRDTKSTVYGKPGKLQLARGVNRTAVADTCVNYKVRSKNQISIVRDKVNVNFSNGLIFIVYYGIPIDENGDFIIPDTQHDRLEIYLEYHLKRKVAEDLILNNDDPNLANKLSYLTDREAEAFSLALIESKAGILDPSSWKTLRNSNRRRVFSKQFPIPSTKM